MFRLDHTQLEEITATFLGERRGCRWGDTFVGEFRLVNGSAEKAGEGSRVFSIKGEASDGELVIGMDYNWLGKWSTYKNKYLGVTEKQFLFDSFTESAPNEREGVIAYLIQAGQGRGIGPARAAAIWDEWGADCVRMLRESPTEVCSKIRGLSFEDAREASTWLNDRKKLEACTIAVTSLLAGRGFRKGTPRWSIYRFGNLAASVILRNPFRLIDSPGTGFKRCDSLWTFLAPKHPHLRLDKLRRQGMAAWYSVTDGSDGSTWVPLDMAKQGVRKQLGSSATNPDRAVEFCLRLGKIAPWRKGALTRIHTDIEAKTVISDGPRAWVSTSSAAITEDRLAGLVVQAMGEMACWPSPESLVGVSDHQRAEYAKATRNGSIAILGGGPGTGKTHTCGAVVKQLAEKYGAGNVSIGTPTGKAGVRLTEAMASHGLKVRARTWYSVMGIGEVDRETGDVGFAHDENNPLKVKVILGDESSMPGTPMFSSIMRARPKNCPFLIVGDINQLPPIEHGAPMRDLIAAGLPYGELTFIHRSSGGIVEACDAIRQGRSWTTGDNLALISPRTPEQQLAETLAEIQRARESGIDPIWDVQTVVAVNKKSPLARKVLNELIQREINPHFPERPNGSPFAIGDKIVCSKNSYYNAVSIDDSLGEVPRNEKGEVFVANGDLGEVIEIAEKRFVARLRNPDRTVIIPRGKVVDREVDEDGEETDKGTGTGCAWELGYALSVHKAQGSEWPWVIVLLDEYAGARRVCSREWLYTSLSRAKSRCVLIGKKTVADAMCKRVALAKRKTFLRELIHLKSAQRVLANL